MCSDGAVSDVRLPDGLSGGDLIAVASPAAGRAVGERLGTLGVPVLAGLPFGHDPDPEVAPLGVPCTLDADAGVLTVSPALRMAP